MKKNILTIIILAALLVNLTLTAMMIFTFIPYTKKADTLITNILQIIDLELESPIAAEEETATEYSLEDIETKVILTEEVANLKVGSDGKAHFAQVTASISINAESEDYKTKNELIDKHTTEIESIFLEEILKYTNENIADNKAVIEEAILTRLQTLFESDFIVKVTLKILVN